MSLRGVLLSTCIAWSTYCSAQITFQKTFGGANNDYAYCVNSTSDRGYIITGWTDGFGAGNRDMYLIRTDSIGNLLWTKTFGGTNNDEGACVIQTLDGGFMTAGTSYSFSVPTSVAYLVKTDASGNVVWSKLYGTDIYDGATCVLQLADSGYIFTGLGSYGAANMRGVYLVRIDAIGNILWARILGNPDINFTTSGSKLIQTSDGGFAVVGTTDYFGAGSNDILLLRTDSIGNTLWMRTYGGTGSDVGSSIKLLPNGGFLIGGGTDSFGGTDMYLIKTDSVGNVSWSKTYSDGAVTSFADMSVNSNGDITIAGKALISASNDDAYLIKANSLGNIIWSKRFGGINYEQIYSMKQTNDNGYVIAGWTNSFGSGSTDIYLIKTDSSGRSLCNETLTNASQASVATTAMSVVPLDSPYVFSQTPVTVTDSGGVSMLLCLNTGEEEVSIPIQGNDIAVYPNPASNEIFVIASLQTHDNVVTVTNMVGETVYQTNTSTGQLKIDIENYPPGVYFVTLTAKSNNRVMKKFVKM